MRKIEIRRAKKEDAGFIALLGRVTFTETFGHLFRDEVKTRITKIFIREKNQNHETKITITFFNL